MVADAWQGRGISTILLAHLAEVAGQHGFSTFVAEVLEVELPTSLSDAAVAQFEERERTGAVAAVRSFLEPRSVAVARHRCRGRSARHPPAPRRRSDW